MLKQLFTIAFCLAAQLSLLSFNPPYQASAAPSPQKEAAFNKLVDDYFNFYFQFHPTSGTQAGLHQYDGKLEDFSRASVEAEVAGLLNFQKLFNSVAPHDLAQDSAGDLEVLSSAVQGRLLELQSIQMWKKDPDVYISDPIAGVFLLMSRNFASTADRLRSVISLERGIPKILKEARRNVANPPRIYTEVSLQQMPDNIKFFQHDVPEAFHEVRDANLLAEFKASNDAAVAALSRYQDFMRKDLLPASNGDFRLGAENFRRKLLYDEMV